MTLHDFIPAVGPHSYVTQRSQTLSDERWRWYWRQHKKRFIDRQAAVLIGGIVHVVPDLADAVILEIGRDMALRRVSALD